MSGRLLAAHQREWERLRSHPLPAAVADGSVEPAAFARWLVEDHFFVVGFRRFLAGLVVIAPHERARGVLSAALGPLEAELELFRREADARALNLAVEPAPTTLGYTSFLVAALADGYDVAVMVLYGAEKAYFDAWSAVRDRVAAGSPYAEFVHNWSSPEFGRWVDDVASLLGSGQPSDAQRRAFARVVRFELRFWDAVASGEAW